MFDHPAPRSAALGAASGCRPTPASLRSVARLLLLGAILAWAGGPAARAAGRLTTLGEFWMLEPAERAKPLPFTFECDVLYHDAAWGNLWLRDATSSVYVPCEGKNFPVRTGQRVRVTGTLFPPNSGIVLDDATFEVIGLARPAPVPVGTRVAQPDLFMSRLVTVDGLVDRQSPADAQHLNLALSIEGRAVQAWVLVADGETAPDFTGRTVRLQGVYNSKVTPGGLLASLEIMVPSLADVTVLSELARDPRFALPAVAIASLPAQPSSTLVRIAGEVQAQEPGHSVRLRDATGQIEVLSAQTLPLEPHAAAEAIGYPVIRGTEWRLEGAVYRPRTAGGGAENADPAARPAGADGALVATIADFWNLTAEQRQLENRLQFECTVLYYDPDWKQLWVSDGTNGVYVQQGDRPLPIEAGQRLRVNGVLPPPNADLSFAKASFAVIARQPAPVVPLGDWSRYNPGLVNRLVETEGLVDRQSVSDAGHLRLFLSVDGRPLYAWVLLVRGAPVPDFAGATVRLRGIYNPKLSGTGVLSSLEIMVPGTDAVTVLHRLANDPRFTRPAVAIESLPAQPADVLVHVVGEVQAQDPGRYLRLRDATGQVDVLTAQTLPLSIHARVEAVGYPSVVGTEWRLAGGVFRPIAGPGDAAAGPARDGTLRIAAQVLELTPEEAGRGLPVVLSGVVTWSHPESPFLFIQDSSGGVCVFRGTDPNKVRPAGRNVEVRGATAMGDFAPVVVATEIVKIGDVLLPDARTVSLEHVLTGVEEAQWVEMRGYLRQVRPEKEWTRLELATTTGDFVALLPPGEPVTQLAGAVVRVSGVCTASANENRKLTGVRLWVPEAKYVKVEEPAPDDVFGVPTRTIASLGRFATLQAFNRRVKVAGTVLHRSAGRFIIEDQGETLVALTRDTHPPVPGERVEAVGFLGRQGSRVVLRETLYRNTGRGKIPAPQPIDAQAAVDPDFDGRLAVVEGVLLDSAAFGAGVHLTVQTRKAVFEAYLDGEPGAPVTAPWELGSRLALTGIYEVKYDEYAQPQAFALLLRTASDVAVLERPPWFTIGRIVALTGALTLGIVLFMVWVAALRRRVQRQTGQIRRQVQREAQLQGELERALRLESLGILAGGIAHDFNNLLTVVMGNVSLARLDRGIDSETNESLAEAERAVGRARDLTQQLLTFAKGGAPVRSAVVVSDIVREVTQFVLRGSSVSCAFELAPDLWAGDVDKGQVSQVVQNIVINAAQAMPDGGRIDVALRNQEIAGNDHEVLPPGRYLHLSIADHGRGIKPEDLPRIFDPYFSTKKQGSGLGLATVYSIVKRHGGHISVDSKFGQGTVFHVWLPAAATAPEAEAPKAAPDDEEPCPGRVLLMDDEESIRKLGITILRRAGLEVVAVKDGAEAVAEYANARRSGRPYDVTVFDLTVPGGMGGKQALEELRRIDPAVRAIVSSGYSNDPVLSDHRALGFCGMVSKPYEVSALVRAVRAAIRGETG